MRNAADLMLPALRRALQSFTKRADIIIRQLTYLHAQKNNDVVEVCRQLASMPEEEQKEPEEEQKEPPADEWNGWGARGWSGAESSSGNALNADDGKERG